MKQNPVLKIVAKIMIPVILLFALYVQFHGDFGPGGGFQAGVIFAAAMILYGMIFGLSALEHTIPPWLLRTLIAFGALLYGGTGFATMYLGGGFLDYNLLAKNGPDGQHLGIFLVELGVGITVAAVMITIFLAFAGRRKVA